MMLACERHRLGTDAMGAPLIVPGASLPRELQLLTESGLNPYEAIRILADISREAVLALCCEPCRSAETCRLAHY
jgi:hypothetical protein